MDYNLITTLNNAPEAFTYTENITRKQLRSGVFALFAESTKEVTGPFPELLGKISGIIITMGKEYSFTLMGTRLWHMTITNAQLNILTQILSSCLSVIGVLRQDHRSFANQALESERVKRQHKRLTEFYASAQEKIRMDMVEKSKWSSAALTKLVTFAAIDLQIIQLKAFPDTIVQFLLDGFFSLKSAAIWKPANSETEINQLVAWNGERKLDLFLANNPHNDLAQLDDFLNVPLLFSNTLHILVVSSSRLKHHFSQNEHSFFRLFSSLVGAIHSQRTTEKQLFSAKESAEAANQSKSEFLANMSHEIRTPLNGVLGMLQLLQETSLDKDQNEFVETALASGKSLLTIMNDILDFSKVEAGKIEIKEELFDVSNLLKSTLRIFHSHATEKNILLSYNIAKGVPPYLLGDSGRIRQVMFNLVGNAIKFTDEGKVLVHLDIDLTPNNSEYVNMSVSITDTGIGIPKDRLEMIFESFSQVDGSHTRKYQGTGLGLSIVKRLVELMNGTIGIESTLGKGTRVHFKIQVKLPAESLKETDAALNHPYSSHDSSGTDKAANAYNILLAEDNLINQKLLIHFLKKMGHKVTAAENGLHVLKHLRKNTFHLILMDIQMPHMDGIETARNIRKIEKEQQDTQNSDNHPIPIIAITAHAMKGDREKFLEAGMNDYLAKPVRFDTLRQIINQVMITK
jgi:signal transduction histidine kinase/CheY-like chemotaxis protein